MKKRNGLTSSTTRSGGYMAAVVLGTALAAMPAVADAGPAYERAGTAVEDMTRYCSACWRNARLHPELWADCTQEVFGRLLERVPTQRWDRALQRESDERREFVRAIDTVKKRTVRARRLRQLSSEVVADGRAVAEGERVTARQTVTEVARRELTTRQDRIISMTLDGWTVAEIAEEMRLPVERVSDEKYKAVRRLRQLLA